MKPKFKFPKNRKFGELTLLQGRRQGKWVHVTLYHYCTKVAEGWVKYSELPEIELRIPEKILV